MHESMVQDVVTELEKVGLRLKYYAEGAPKPGWAYVWTASGQRGFGFPSEAAVIAAAVADRITRDTHSRMIEPVRDYEGTLEIGGSPPFRIGYRSLVVGDIVDLRVGDIWIRGTIVSEEHNTSKQHLVASDGTEIGLRRGQTLRIQADAQI